MTDGLMGALERWSPTLLLVGGVIVVGFAAIETAPAVTDTSFPMVRDALTIGYVFAFIGLLGLYPGLSHRHKWLARTGAVAAALGAVGFSVNALKGIGQLAGVVGQELPAWTKAFVPLMMIGMIVGYLALGIASLRSDRYSTRLSLFLLLPGIVFVVLFVTVVTIGTGQWGFIFSGLEALGILGIGYLLRTEGASTDGATSSQSSPG